MESVIHKINGQRLRSNECCNWLCRLELLIPFGLHPDMQIMFGSFGDSILDPIVASSFFFLCLSTSANLIRSGEIRGRHQFIFLFLLGLD